MYSWLALLAPPNIIYSKFEHLRDLSFGSVERSHQFWACQGHTLGSRRLGSGQWRRGVLLLAETKAPNIISNRKPFLQKLEEEDPDLQSTTGATLPCYRCGREHSFLCACDQQRVPEMIMEYPSLPPGSPCSIDLPLAHVSYLHNKVCGSCLAKWSVSSPPLPACFRYQYMFNGAVR